MDIYYCVTTSCRGRLHRALGMGIALTVFCANVASAAIGDTWPDRRPIGQIIFAGVEDISAQNLNGWVNGGPVTLGTAAFQKDILARVNSTIQNTLAVHGQGILIWDITGCGKTNPALPNQEYLGDPRFLDPKRSGLTVPTPFSPYVPPTSRLGQQGLGPAMNAIADRVFARIRDAGLVPGVCIRAQKVCINSNGDLDGTKGQLAYDTTPHQLADLDAKITYAYNRWGCRIFYVDSNVAANDVTDAEANQGNARWTPAWVYTQLWQRHPDCLICPEETYPGAFHFASLGINDPAYQYDRVACRYTELRAPWQAPSIHSDEAAAVPSVFNMVLLSEAAVTDMSGNIIGVCENKTGVADPSTLADMITQLQNRQTILLADDVTRSRQSLAIWLQQQAHVNGF
jgi:hypothetical protein